MCRAGHPGRPGHPEPGHVPRLPAGPLQAVWCVGGWWCGRGAGGGRLPPACPPAEAPLRSQAAAGSIPAHSLAASASQPLPACCPGPAGTLVFPKNKYVVLRMGQREVLCEDVLESLVRRLCAGLPTSLRRAACMAAGRRGQGCWAAWLALQHVPVPCAIVPETWQGSSACQLHRSCSWARKAGLSDCSKFQRQAAPGAAAGRALRAPTCVPLGRPSACPLPRLCSARAGGWAAPRRTRRSGGCPTPTGWPSRRCTKSTTSADAPRVRRLSWPSPGHQAAHQVASPGYPSLSRRRAPGSMLHALLKCLNLC